MNTAAASAAETAPDFSYKELGSGKTMRLSDLKGKPVFINFWATWCLPVSASCRILKRNNAEYKDKCICYSQLDDNEQDPARFIQSKGYTFPAAYGDHQALGRATALTLFRHPTSSAPTDI